MTEHGYEIKPYKPEMISATAELLKDFWGGKKDERQAYIKWKYENNPHAHTPLAVVALYKGNVVGFRGYFAADWCIGREGLRVTILSPGDTFTHVEHRRKGLSVLMGKKANDIYADRYRIFLNLSATKPSVPGYLTMGYFPLRIKAYLNSYSIMGLSRFLLNIIFPNKLQKNRVRYGRYGDVLISNRPRPSDMAKINAEERKLASQHLLLFQDESYFKWRFENGRNEYIFYYFIRDTVATGYIVVRRPPGSPRGYVIDYGDMDGKSLGPVLDLLVHTRHFDVLSIYNYSLDMENLGIFRRYGFSSRGMMRVLEKWKRGEWPLFVRPIKTVCTEDDWRIEGVDIRKKEHWKIKEICSDSV